LGADQRRVRQVPTDRLSVVLRAMAEVDGGGSVSPIDRVCVAAGALLSLRGAGLSLMVDGELRGTAGVSDPVEGMRRAVRAWLEICAEPEIARIALIDGPSVLGWARWREVCQRHVFGLVEVVLAEAMDMGRIRRQPLRPLAHVMMGASDEAALYVVEAVDRPRARAEMIEVLDQLIAGVTQ